MQVLLIRTWGANPARTTVDVDDIQGQWLIDHGFGTFAGDTRTHEEVEGAMTPTHSTRPATQHNRAETGVAGNLAGSPDAVHNRVQPPAADKTAQPPKQRPKQARTAA